MHARRHCLGWVRRVRVDVLGPLRLVVDGGAVDVRGPKRRAVLALLAMAEGRAVTVDQLVDALWPVEPPDSARASPAQPRLPAARAPRPGRRAAQTLDGGYRLALGADGLDVRAGRALRDGARDLARTDPAAAAALLREARGLWRGPALADFAEVAPLATAATGLEQLHREVDRPAGRCAIDAGQVDGASASAADALAADPLREPAVLLLMRALAATGQAAQALRTGAGLPAPAGRGNRPGSVVGAGRTGAAIAGGRRPRYRRPTRRAAWPAERRARPASPSPR